MIDLRLTILLPVLLTNACTDTSETPVPPVPRVTVQQMTVAWRSLSESRRDDLLESTHGLDQRVRQFLDRPGKDTRQAMQAAWRQCHDNFVATRTLFVGKTNDLLFRIDAWPVLEGFLDATNDHPTSGIVNDSTLPVDAPTLIDQHGITSDQEVSLGFHALEYFAFSRPIEDYRPDSSDNEETISRRRAVLATVTELLVMDLEQFADMIIDRTASLDVLTMISSLSDSATRLEAEADLLIHENNGHSRFSQSSRENLQTRLESINQIAREPVGLVNLMLELDTREAKHFILTLERALARANKPADDDEKLYQLVSALDHQLAELQRMLHKTQRH